MALPDLIEIVPLAAPVRAEITVPGSKSITNRALILAALADGVVTLEGALWSEDTQVMTDCLRALGFTVDVQPDPAESCNRTITVDGLGGRLPRAGTAEQPLELFVGNAGTAARFLAAMVCLGDGVYRLHGVPRMHERPIGDLVDALRGLGCAIDDLGNPGYPPLLPGSEAATLHFIGRPDVLQLGVQHWIVVVAFLSAAGGLLATRVRPAIVAPCLALLAFASANLMWARLQREGAVHEVRR